jgi:hypothetical protein
VNFDNDFHNIDGIKFCDFIEKFDDDCEEILHVTLRLYGGAVKISIHRRAVMCANLRAYYTYNMTVKRRLVAFTRWTSCYFLSIHS